MRNPARTDHRTARAPVMCNSTRKHEEPGLARRIATAIASDFKADFAAHQARWFFVTLSACAAFGTWLGGAQ